MFMQEIDGTNELHTQSDVHSDPSAKPETTDTDPQTAEQAAKEPVNKTFTQSELDAIVQKRVAKIDAKSARRIEQMHRETLQHLAPQQKASPKAEISRDAYENDAQWIDAKVEARLKERDAQSQAVQQRQATESIILNTEKLYAQAEKISGFDREAFDDLPISPAIASALMESDIAPKLMAHLLANPAEVDRIIGLSSGRQAVEIGKMEAVLSSAPRGSRAPSPITPLGAGGKSNIGDIQSMSADDFYEMRQKQGAKYYR